MKNNLFFLGTILNYSTNTTPKSSHHHALLMLINNIEITEKIKQACDSRQYACGIFFDLKKAFDTVSHNILLRKIKY